MNFSLEQMQESLLKCMEETLKKLDGLSLLMMEKTYLKLERK